MNENPQRRTCGAMIQYHTLLETDPHFRQRQLALHKHTLELACGRVAERVGTVTIPTVVHVLYLETVDNISDDQVKSQLDVLNQDFSATNADIVKVPAVWKPLVTDSQIRFVLATHDPQGNPTTGIHRVHTPKTGFSQADNGMKFAALGGADAWDTSRYLNLWVCEIVDQLLGYSQFPGGPAATDGVVIRNTAFGTTGIAQPPFNRGRTTVHEVGHWLNLFHIWGDTQDCSGTDYVEDTPNAQQPNFGDPKYPNLSCSNGPNGDMFMNHMDYTSDETMIFFTQGQVARMRATLSGPRSSLGMD